MVKGTIALAGFDERQVVFDNWRLWRPRSTSELGRGGLYLFGHFRFGAPSAAPTLDRLPSEMVYVGDAKDLSVRPLSGAHHRIARYIRLTRDRRLDYLHVSVAPLYETGCADYDLWRICSFYLEALITWRYVQQHGRPPLLHFKDKGKQLPRWVQDEVQRLRKLKKQNRSTARTSSFR